MKKAIVAAVVVAALLVCSALSAQVPPPPKKFGQVEWHGYSLNRLFAAEGAGTRLSFQRFSVSALLHMNEKVSAYAEGYLQPYFPDAPVFDQYKYYLESAYVDLKPELGIVRIGKGRRQTFGITPSYPNRKTSNYGVVSEMFSQSRVVGAQWFGTKNGLDFGIGAFSTLRLGNAVAGDITRPANHRTSNLADKDVPTDMNSSLEIAARIGAAQPNGIKYGVTASSGKLMTGDLAYINNAFGGTHTSERKVRKGAYLIVPRTPWIVQGEIFDADTSDIDHVGWQILAGYEPKGKMRFYARWAEVDMDTAATSNSFTWDKKQLTLSAVKPLQKGIWAQLEWEHNMESPPAGVGKINNDVLFLELFTGF